MFSHKQKLSTLFGSLLCLAACRANPSPIHGFVENKRTAVFVFLAPDCPLSQSYTLTLKQLHSKFRPSDVAFYGVFSGSGATKKAVDDFVRTYKIEFPTLSDPKLNLADFFGATKTPEVFAVDSKEEIFYKGAIDNGAPELGQHRTVITAHYLEDALDRFLQNRSVELKETKAVGCFIERPVVQD